MAKIIFPLACLFSLSVAASDFKLSMPVPQELRIAAKELLAAIGDRDWPKLEQMAESKAELDRTESIGKDVYGMLYEPDGGELKTYIEIMSLDEIVTRIFVERADYATVYYVPKKFLEESESANFYREEFGQKFFACAFTKTPKGWKVSSGFCFIYTEGPNSSSD